MAAIVINIDPVLIQLGPLAVRWYGLMYVVGIIAGVQAILPYVRTKGITDDQVWSVLGPCIVAGIIGGRLFYVVQQPLEPFLAQPWRIIATWEGGMAFYGAIGAVMIALALMCWKDRIPFWPLLDGAAIFAAVGQTFGRIGNLINGDILGAPTDLPWGIVYANPNSFAPSHTVAYQPAAIYEMLCDLVLIALLYSLRYRLKTPGLLATVYLIGYAVTQFVVFFLRYSEPVVAYGLKQAQLTSIVVFVLALGLGAWRLSTSRGLAGERAPGGGETAPTVPPESQPSSGYPRG